jgi:hypothetical protein
MGSVRRVAVAAVAALSLWPPSALTAGQVQAQGMSAIGNEAPLSFAVSPDYARTHLVAAIAVPVGGCSSQCTHVWVTRDGGASWRRSGALYGAASRLVVVHGASGGEVLAAEMPDALAESGDDGATWHAVGAAGTPFAQGDALVVAGHGGQDYVLSPDGAVHDVAGSDGASVDLAFSVSPPAPALLAAENPRSGAPLVLQCDASLSCSHAVTLVGSDPRTSSDLSLLRAPGDVVYARTGSAVYRSSDGGRSFLPVPLPARQSGAVYTTIPAAALGAASGARTPLYVAMLEMIGAGQSRLTAGGVYVSPDGGATWRAVGSPGPLDGGATSVMSLPDGRLLAGYVNAHGDAGLVCSADDVHWAATCSAATASCTTACGTASTSPGERAAPSPAPQMRTVAVPADAAAQTQGVAAPVAATPAVPRRGGNHAERAVVVVVAVCTLLAAVALSTLRRRRRRW